MFQKESLIQSYAFKILDITALTIALLLSNVLRFGRLDLRAADNLYIEVYVVAVLANLFCTFMFQLDHKIFDRGLYQEFIAVIKSSACIGVAVLAYLYVTQKAIDYSRLQLGYFFFIYFIADYLGHILGKKFIAKYYKNSRSCKQIMLITTSDKVNDVLKHFDRTNNWYFQIAYIAILDERQTGRRYEGIPVIADSENMIDAAKNIALDGVFINLPFGYQSRVDIREVLHEFQEMGVVVHVNIDALELDVTDKVIENLGFYKVVSYTNRLQDTRQLVAKRLMDILGSIIGIVITIIASIFVVPAICIDSPGEPIYSQIRVGKNGRRFRMYKFRSMYVDADQRKAELESQNQVKGAAFKIADDPRVTKVGRFIRKYSIDELPQFFNVLKGDMSLVGTRPPLVEEVEKYRVEQKRRLSVTPGMTGLWQVSGRNEVYDFDEIVKLDLTYIDQWSIGLDIKLLMKTIAVCFTGKGAE